VTSHDAGSAEFSQTQLREAYRADLLVIAPTIRMVFKNDLPECSCTYRVPAGDDLDIAACTYLHGLIDAVLKTSKMLVMPLHTTGDGSCMLNAASRCIWGVEVFADLLRLRLLQELKENPQGYVDKVRSTSLFAGEPPPTPSPPPARL